MEKQLYGVVSGATKGIGKAVVEKLAAGGMNVLFCARTASEVQDFEQKLKLKYPKQHFLGLVCDVSSSAGQQNLADAVKAWTKQVDFLLNNAGTFEPGMIHTEAAGVLEKLTATNVYSAYHITRALLPLMMPFKKGHIFNMCSTASITAYTNGGSYCITKFALLGFSKVLREELKDHLIKVTAILPGATYTPSWEQSGIDESRFMQASDVADMIWQVYTLGPNAVVEELLMRPMAGDL